MTAIVIEHVPVADLPPAWRAQRAQTADTLGTVRIEKEEQAKAKAKATAPAAEFVSDDPAFGIWRDREDLADIQASVRQLRAPRYGRDGARMEST
ncbi:hypothetical protein OOZ63_14290 [Paucibacter sp. PLA-PC-4]|uniref:hypothetical protein n=1 Tax=Paucibacter sp. PLA-PC-4 TaxID=2993655 RepID=UPI002248F718|nr:hypothetical protein [Paucibacter sp. PLA-PC-4]MCX2862997.1 hypothetical protein [Paucibacter sp. PLA-PC-4]